MYGVPRLFYSSFYSIYPGMDISLRIHREVMAISLHHKESTTLQFPTIFLSRWILKAVERNGKLVVRNYLR